MRDLFIGAAVTAIVYVFGWPLVDATLAAIGAQARASYGAATGRATEGRRSP